MPSGGMSPMKAKQIMADKREYKKKYDPPRVSTKEYKAPPVLHGMKRAHEVAFRRYLLRAKGVEAVFAREAMLPLT